MITVNFYNFSKKEKSTAQPGTSPVELQCALKEPCSVIRPSLQLKFNGYPGYNYCYIPEFGRYYWLDDWVWNRGLWESDLTVDALASFKTEIGSSELYILRSAYSQDGYVTDTLFPMTNKVLESSTTAVTLASGRTGMYVVGVIGKLSNAAQPVGGITYLGMTESVFQAFRDALFSDDLAYLKSGITAEDIGLTEIGESMAKMLFDPYQYIVSVVWTPEPLDLSVAVKQWTVGFWDFTVPNALDENIYIINPKQLPAQILHTRVNIPRHPLAATRGEFMSAAPYTEIALDIPTVGLIPLDTTKLLNAVDIRLDLVCDAAAGKSTIKIWAEYASGDTRSSYLLSEYSAGYVIPIQLARSGVSLGSMVSHAASNLVNFAGAMAGAIAAPGVGTIAGAANAAISAPQGIFTPQPQITGGSGSWESQYFGIGLRAIFYDVVPDDNEHFGRPLCRKAVLSGYPGFQQIMDGDVVSNRATAQELRDIKAALESGYFYE